MPYCTRCESYYHDTKDCPYSWETIEWSRQKRNEEETLKELKRIRELLEKEANND